jgi:hypothetical protein
MVAVMDFVLNPFPASRWLLVDVSYFLEEVVVHFNTVLYCYLADRAESVANLSKYLKSAELRSPKSPYTV